MTSLRIGLLVDSLTVPAWVHQLTERLLTLETVHIALVVDGGNPSPAKTLLDSYLNLERRLLRGLPNPLAPTSLRALLPDTPVFSASDLQKIQSQRIDILIGYCGDGSAKRPERVGHNHTAARLGVWTWDDLNPATGFREVLEQNPITTCTLFAQLPNGENKTIRSAVFATAWISAARNQNHFYVKTASTLMWALKKLSLTGEENFFEEGFHHEEAKSTKVFGVRDLGALILSQAKRALEKQVRPKRQWVLMAGKSAGRVAPDWDALRPIVPPRNVYWADPMAVEREGQLQVLAEEYVYETRRGRIACLTLDEQGRITSNQVAFERPYHLSYPFTFEHRGETYMIPETASQRAVELYRCARWPDHWEFVHALMSNIYAVDSTLLEHGGRWWLFTNVKGASDASSWDELHLFHADDPLSTNWTPHPLNPVFSDVRVARPAGPFFTFEGTLYRPSQDCSQRYGYAVNVNRVDTLTETAYAETRVETVIPRPPVLVTHTLSRAAGWVLMDGARGK
jgi:hypothetical protein